MPKSDLPYAITLSGVAAGAILGIALIGAEPVSAEQDESVVQRCDWEACAAHYCVDDGGCVQLTAYRY
jgi:hypothetical protein